MNSPKVVFIHLLNDYSGSPLVLSQVIKTCENKGYRVELYTGSGTKGFLTDITPKHFTYFYKRSEYKFLTFIFYLISQIILFFKLLKYKDENVILYINTLLPFGAGLAGLILGKRVIYHIHEMSLSPTILKKILRKIVKVSSSANLYVSKFLLGNDAIPGIKSFCIYNAPVNKILAESVQFEYPQDDTGRFTILMISSLKDYKGIPEILKLASRLIQEDNIRFELVLNAGLPEIKRYFSGYDVPGNIVIHPKSEDIISFYKRAHLVLNLSRVDQWIETFGLTILEAMAFGIPIIAPPVGGPTEMVDDGINGYLIDSREIDQVVDKIKELSNDPELCLKLSKAAREKAKLFSPDKFKKQILEVLEYVENI